ncbi:MAG: PmoA family protein [Planctomycetaceae bacterium]|jgi:hypothetical protein|nr:PmoA family protein [Planctomycetaceae bacterium]
MKHLLFPFILSSAVSFVVSSAALPAAEEELVKSKTVSSSDRVTVKTGNTDRLQFLHGGPGKELFKPYISILTTPEGRNILRDAPADHIHHHGLMFAVKIDGVNFWEERPGNKAGKEILDLPSFVTRSDIKFTPVGKEGKTELSRWRETMGGHLDWCNPAGEKLASEDRHIVFLLGGKNAVPDAVLVDWTSAFSPAPGRQSVKIGGNDYHGLGMRFHESMDKNGTFFSDNEKNPAEHLRGTENLTVCNWMAYTANLDDKPVTVAVFDCPVNVRKMRAFTMQDGKTVFAYLSATVNLHREPVTATHDKPVVFRYGVCLWEGRRTAEEVEKAYQQWLQYAAHP